MSKQYAYDAAVIGSGPNGLAAAITVARAGRSVVVYEARDTIGGGSRSTELTLPGFVHDICSAIHPLGLGSPFFRSLPLTECGLDWIHPPLPLAHPLDSGSCSVLHRSVADSSAGLGADGRAYDRLMRPLVDRWEDLADEFLQPMLHWPRHPVLLAQFGLHGLPSASCIVLRFFRHEPAK